MPLIDGVTAAFEIREKELASVVPVIIFSRVGEDHIRGKIPGLDFPVYRP